MQSFRRGLISVPHATIPSFNLLRRYAVIPTRHFQPAGNAPDSFNLLRRYAVIPTGEEAQGSGQDDLFQSPTEICSHSDLLVHAVDILSNGFNLLRRYAVIPTMLIYFSPIAGMLVSISYGDMQSFRPHK